MGTLLDFLPRETIFILCEPESLAVHAETYAQQIPLSDPFFIPWPDLLAQLAAKQITAICVAEAEKTDTANTQFQSLDAFRPLGERAPDPQIAEAQRREFFNQLHRWLRQGHAVHVFCNNDGERQRFGEIWEELGLGNVGQASSLSPSEGKTGWENGNRLEACPTLHIGTLARGFFCEAAKLVVVTDAEIFGRYKIQRPRRLKSPHALATHSVLDIDFTELEEGDFVVHIQYGIGRYLGLKNLPATSRIPNSELPTPNSGTECLVIEYAPRNPGDEPPKLYVPVTEAHLVGKYVGVGKVRPPLNTLGGTRWNKAKKQAERAVRDVAAELLQIQAVRESQAGHAFPADVPWQREFEGSFIFEETPDQLRTIGETKSDMERAKPMDRLICGDVGFGKTEVALRAAFIAAMNGKQVAVVVPTTLLARQHMKTFSDRLRRYPVKIGQASRLVSAAELARVKKGVADGQIDIVIGTHALLGKTIKFKDLGLIVVDEEQHFGVAHKEKLKQLRAEVHVLTLTATPIPRTLQLALSGVREMSIIATPPVDRLAVRTFVAPFDPIVVREALLRERYRGGQSFFVCPRIEDLADTKAFLDKTVPEVRVAVAHGQMPSTVLEDVMAAFYDGKFNVLLSTSIVESGLDIPTANTLIVHRADMFGLSQIYQLRGRVGRAKLRAYALLTLPANRRITPQAERRLKVLQSLDTLGAGFQIASHDLDIRGAGNLLGEEQSGHIKEVGYELYQQMLEEAVLSLKAGISGPVADKWSPQITIGTPVLIPEEYVADLPVRLALYRRLAEIEDDRDIEAFAAELVDRFGPLPQEVEYLLQVVSIKSLCRRANVERIEVGPKGAVLSFRDNIFANPEGLIAYIGKYPEGARVRPDMKVVFFEEWETPSQRLKGAAGILRALAGLAEKAAKAA